MCVAFFLQIMREVAWVVFDEIHYMRDKGELSLCQIVFILFWCRIIIRMKLTTEGQWWHLIASCLSGRNSVQIASFTGQEKILRCTCPVDKCFFCFSCPTLNSTCPLGKLGRSERTSMFYDLSSGQVSLLFLLSHS